MQSKGLMDLLLSGDGRTRCTRAAASPAVPCVPARHVPCVPAQRVPCVPGSVCPASLRARQLCSSLAGTDHLGPCARRPCRERGQGHQARLQLREQCLSAWREVSAPSSASCWCCQGASPEAWQSTELPFPATHSGRGSQELPRERQKHPRQSCSPESPGACGSGSSGSSASPLHLHWHWLHVAPVEGNPPARSPTVEVMFHSCPVPGRGLPWGV